MGKTQYNRIKTVLTETGKSGRDLATYLKKNESTISRWCTNDAQPSIETLFEIADYLEVDVRELLKQRNTK